MKKSDLKKISNRFWVDSGLKMECPRPIEDAVIRNLPISIVKMKVLTYQSLSQWFAERNLVGILPHFSESLLGGIFAFKGNALLFVDAKLPSYEMRYTVAHEVGHFLFDYHYKRQKAKATVGDSAEEILDGTRRASLGERVDAILLGIDLKPYYHLLSDQNCISISRGQIETAEDNADFLADELIAPEDIINEMYNERGFESIAEASREIAGILDVPEYVVARQIRTKPHDVDFLSDLRKTLKG